MRHPSTLVKQLLVLALPLYAAAGSFGSTLALQACRHMAMHHATHHDGPAGGTCWCDDMTGGGLTLQPVAEALPPVTTFSVASAPGVAPPVRSIIRIPDSPSYAPIPPPPNGRFS